MRNPKSFQPFSSLPQFADLEQLKRRARELQKSFDDGDEGSRELVAFHLPKHLPAQPLKLAHAQFVIARSHGFKSWPRLKNHVEARALTDQNAGDALLRAVFESNDFLLAALFERCRTLAPENVHVAAALADRDALAAFLTRSPELAGAEGGPGNCTPLVYLCHAQLAKVDPSFAARQVAAARDLLDRGADANAAARIEGHEGALSALYGTCRWPGNPELCALLLERGAKVSDGESLYHACELEDLRCLKLLLEHGPADQDREYCIVRMIDQENAAGIALFLEHGTSPNHLDWALFRDRGIECQRVLVEHGADVDMVCKANWLLKRVDGLSPMRIAERNGRPEITRLILAAGARDNRTPADFLIGACVRGDRPAVDRLLVANRGLVKSLTPNDHSYVAAVARSGNLPAVEIMLDVGFDIDAKADDVVASALNYAGARGDVAMTKLLLERGADRGSKNQHGGDALGTALWCAAHFRNPAGDYSATMRLLLDAGLPLSEEMLPVALDHGLLDIEELLVERSSRP